MCDRLAVRKGELRFVMPMDGQKDREADFELTTLDGT